MEGFYLGWSCYHFKTKLSEPKNVPHCADICFDFECYISCYKGRFGVLLRNYLFFHFLPPL